MPLQIHVSCEVEGGAAFDAVIADLSLQGARIEMTDPPSFGTKLTLHVALPGATARSKLPATVRWTDAASFGVQFGLLGAHDTHRIAELMRGKARSTSQT